MARAPLRDVGEALVALTPVASPIPVSLDEVYDLPDGLAARQPVKTLIDIVE